MKTEKIVSLRYYAIIISLTLLLTNNQKTHAFVPSSSMLLKSSSPKILSSLHASTAASYDRFMFTEEQQNKRQLHHQQQQQQQPTTTTTTTTIAPTTAQKQPRISKRARFLHFLGVKKLPTKQTKILSHEEDLKDKPESWNGYRIKVTTEEGLDEYFADAKHRFRKKKKNANAKTDTETKTTKNNDISDNDNDYDYDDIDYNTLLKTLHVEGDTQIIGSPSHPNRVHPVLQLLHNRRRHTSRGLKHWRENDDFKVALAIEGGGMRGCVSAGMVAAIHYLGLEDTFDAIYGSSAGSVIGSYLITRQLPWYGPEIYYDSLSKAGLEFIDTKRIVRAMGFGLLDPRLLKDVIVRPKYGKPVLNLSYLLKKTAQKEKPLDWEAFKEKQKVQPLKIVASALNKEQSVVMDMEKGSFQTLDELTECMHASCLLPGITGPLVHTNVTSQQTKEQQEGNAAAAAAAVASTPEKDGSDDKDKKNLEPLADALIYETIPYRSAIKEGATHVVVLRTRPDGVDVTGKSSVFERLILKRFFLRKNKFPNIYQRMKKHLHKKQYAQDVIALNKAAYDDERDYADVSKPHLMTVAVGPDEPEVTKLETGRKEIFEGVRRGFARAYDAFVEDPAERGRGAIVAKQYFPDEILDYNPSEIDSSSGTSAFEVFLKEMEEKGEGYDHLPDTLGKTAAQSGASR